MLNLDDNNLSLGVLGFNVNTVVLVVARFLIRFAVKQLHDSHFLLYQYRDKTLEHHKISLAAKYVLRCPVKTYVLTVTHLNSFLLIFTFLFHSV